MQQTKKYPLSGGHSQYMGAYQKFHRNYTKPTAEIIKQAISSADFYATELPDMPPPKRGEWVDGGLCPFHADRTKGSFRVHLHSGAYKCFSCDAKGQDIIAFVQARDGLSFREAIEQLADDWGVTA